MTHLTPLADYFRDTFAPSKTCGSPKSAKLNRIALQLFDAFLTRPAVVGDLNDKTLANFEVWMMATRKASTALVYRRRLVTIQRAAAVAMFTAQAERIEAAQRDDENLESWADCYAQERELSVNAAHVLTMIVRRFGRCWARRPCYPT